MKYEEIKSLLDSIPDPVMKLEILMDIGRSMDEIPTGKQGKLITGCSSMVKIWKDPETNKIYADADSDVVRGIVSVLIAMKTDGVDFKRFSELDINLGSRRLGGIDGMIAYLNTL